MDNYMILLLTFESPLLTNLSSLSAKLKIKSEAKTGLLHYLGSLSTNLANKSGTKTGLLHYTERRKIFLIIKTK
jgi:hypothetical protein